LSTFFISSIIVDHTVKLEVAFCVQGVVSPILANAYLHYALDLWFEIRIKRECNGEVLIVRYANDSVCAFQMAQSAQPKVELQLGRIRRLVEPVFDTGSNDHGKVPKQAAETLCVTPVSA
jgi:hypothetical protein